MKIKLSMIVLILCFCVNLFAQVSKDSLDEFEWILGTWNRQKAKPGVTHHEKWWKISDQHFQGVGVTMVGKDTTFVEKLSIMIEAGSIYYIADIQENPEPVYFKFTSWEENSFVSENPEHDAPKKIAYTLDGNTMTTKVSWDDGGFEAVFVRQD